MRNRQLLAAFPLQDTCDLGLDALDVIDDASTANRLVAFSTEDDARLGTFTHGDVLATNGAIIPNAALFANFNPRPTCAMGLDALQFTGPASKIRDFLILMASNPPPPPAAIAGILKNMGLDILFSTESTCSDPAPALPLYLDGDVLSVMGGGIAIPHAALMAVVAQPGIPGLDRGCDGLMAPRNRDLTQAYFSTEINNINPLLTDGDILRVGVAAPILNYGAVAAPFNPPAPFLRLDAISYFK